MQAHAHVRFPRMLPVLLTVLLVGLYTVFPVQGLAAPAAAAGTAPVAARAPAAFPTNQIIIKYKSSADARLHPAAASQMLRLSQLAGIALQYRRTMSGGAHVLRLPASLPLAQVQAIAARLAASPDVQYAVPDRRIFPAVQPARPNLLSPNDTDYSSQWNLTGGILDGIDTQGIDALAAWDVTTGSSSVVVAVLDSGITSHAEFSGRTVPGYDFISDIPTANDGDGRDADPSDPGDWITADDNAGTTYSGTFTGCPVVDSTWHGTHSAGIIAATGDNGLGVAGLNWGSKILPVRVSGKCGGNESDAIDGMRWAAGISVSGVPDNTNPAKILNLSLAGLGSCDSPLQTTVNDIIGAGAVVVVSAGNYAMDANSLFPGNCSGVINVAAIGLTGGLASYSDSGSSIAISAPGGDENAGLNYGILSTLNLGTQGPTADSYDYQMGTSEAAPQVSGVASLLFSLDPALTPSQVLTILKDSARAFPATPDGYPADPSPIVCTGSTCGSGILDAGAAVGYLLAHYDAGTPSVTAFSASTPSASLTIPITAFSGTDDMRVTGYMITVSATPPLATDGGWSATAPTSFTVGAEGPYVLHPWVKDTSGHVSAVNASVSVTVDTTPPDTGIGSHPSNPDKHTTPVFTFIGSDGTGSGVASYQCQMDGASYAACATPYTSAVLPDGLHTLYVEAIDHAGNIDASPATYAWVVDTTAPSVSSSVPADPNPTSLSSVDFTVSFSEAVTGVDEGDFSLATSGVTGAALGTVSGSGASYTVSVNTGTGNGSIRLDVLANGSIQDVVGNPLGAVYSSGQAYTVNKPITLTLSSTGAQDGWVLESSQYSSRGGSLNSKATVFRLGDDAGNRQYRAILSFNTALLPVNAILQSALLKIRQSGAPVGTSPFNVLGSLWADIRKGPFGVAALQLTDFNAAASAMKVGAFNKTPASGWYTEPLSAPGLGKINFTGPTQFRLYFAKGDNNNHRADYMQFVSGDGSSSLRPQLVITYTLP